MTRARPGARLAFAAAALALAGGLAWTAEALRRVRFAESERDRWQRSDAVLEALGPVDGGVVGDVGSGVGYFALKLSDQVGPRGRVLAVDVRRLPLSFLRLRALVEGRGNVETVQGREDDPRLPPGVVDAVLLANTYHELTRPGAVLERVFAALRPGGRLVVVDPGGREVEARPAPGIPGHHHETLASAESALRTVGFEILRREDRFLERSDHGPWWLLVGRKPQSGPATLDVPSRRARLLASP